MKRSIAHILAAVMIFTSAPLGTYAVENTDVNQSEQILLQEEQTAVSGTADELQTAPDETIDLEEDDSSRFEKQDNVYAAKTQVWDFGSYLINDKIDDLKEYNAKYLVDSAREATVTNNGRNYSGSPLANCYDGNWKTHWETGVSNGGNHKNTVTFEFQKEETIGRIIYRARVNGAPGKGFPKKYNIYYQEECKSGEDFTLWAKGSMDTVTTDPIEISFPQRKFKKLRFEFEEADQNWAAATEFAFYKADHAKEDYAGLFLDGACSSLAYGVKLENVLKLEKQLNKYPEPLKGLMENYIEAALSILKVPERGKNITEPITMSQRGSQYGDFGRVRTTFVIGGQYDITGYYVCPGETFGVYASFDPKGPAPRVVLATANHYPQNWYYGWEGRTLSNGYNEFTCGKDMKGCQLIYLYNPALPQDQEFPPVARIAGGTKYPVYRYNSANPELSDNEDEFEKFLTEYASKTNPEHAVEERGEANFNVCELVSDEIVLTSSATGTLKGMKIETKVTDSEGNEKIYRGVKDAMSEWTKMISERYAKYLGYNMTDPTDPDYRPRPAFLWRVYTQGAGWGWAQSIYAGINAGAEKESDPWDSGNYQSFASAGTVLSAGWGTYHELGHVFDSGLIGRSESTNNLMALMSSVQFGIPTRMENDNRWYKHYLTGLNTGIFPTTDLIFYPATMIFQLEIANMRDFFKETELYDDVESVYGKACRYARQHINEINGLAYDDKLAVCLSMGMGVDLSDYFTRMGHPISENGRWLLRKLPKETRPLYYINDRTLKGGAFTEEQKGKTPNVTAKVTSENGSAKIVLDITEGTYKVSDDNEEKNLQCYVISRRDETQKETEYKFRGITGDDLSTKAKNELYFFEDGDVTPGHSYKYKIEAIDCTMQSSPKFFETDEQTVPSDAFVPLTWLGFTGSTGITLKTGESKAVHLEYAPLSTTYDLNAVEWKNNDYEYYTISEDPNHPGDPTWKLITAGNRPISSNIRISAGGSTNSNFAKGYGKGADGKYLHGPLVSLEYKINVVVDSKEAVLKGVTIENKNEEWNKDGITLAPGQSVQLLAAPVPANAENVSAIEWSSSEDGKDKGEGNQIIDLDTNGKVTAKNVGKATVTATVRDEKDASKTFMDNIEIIVSNEAPKLQDINIVSWAEGSNKYPYLYADLASAHKMTVQAVPFNAQVDPDCIEWKVESARALNSDEPGYVPEDDTPEKNSMIEEAYPYIIIFNHQNLGRDVITNIGSPFPAIVTVSATLYENPVVDEDGNAVAEADKGNKILTDTIDILVRSGETPPANGVKTLSINQGSASLDLTGNNETELELTANPTKANGGDSIQWTSSNPDVAVVSPVFESSVEAAKAAVSENGESAEIQKTTQKAIVTAVKPGKATITGYWGGKQSSCEVTVNGEITLNDVYFQVGKDIKKDNISKDMIVGDTYQLLLYPNPIDATNLSDVEWESDNTDAATVNPDTGLVTAVGSGTANITGTIIQNKNGNNTVEKSRICTVTVKDKIIPLTGISISESTCDMKVGDTANISLSPRPMNANNGFEKALWKSSNEGIASVELVDKENNDGGYNAIITAKYPGTCKISAELGNYSVECTVIVEKEKVPVVLDLYEIENEARITDGTVEMEGVNDKTWLACRLKGTNIGSNDVYWNSSNSNIAAVDQNGVVTALAPGKAVISATSASHGSSASCTVNIPDNQAAVPAEPSHHTYPVENIAPIGGYEGKLHVSKTVTENEIKITVIPIAEDSSIENLPEFKLYMAEYMENAEKDKGISDKVTVGTETYENGNLTLTVARPKQGNYRLMLWDSNQCPVTDEIQLSDSDMQGGL